jgi:hypothetical protein
MGTKTYIHFRSYLAQFFLERETFQTSCRENQSTCFVFNNIVLKFVPFMR